MWVQDTYKSKSRAFSLGLFADCFRASDVVCLWCSFGALCTRCGALGWLNLLPGSGGKIQNAFKKIYRREETVRQDKKIGRWDQAGGGPAEWIKGCKFRVLVVRGSVGFRPGP